MIRRELGDPVSNLTQQHSELTRLPPRTQFRFGRKLVQLSGGLPVFSYRGRRVSSAWIVMLELGKSLDAWRLRRGFGPRGFHKLRIVRSVLQPVALTSYTRQYLTIIASLKISNK